MNQDNPARQRWSRIPRPTAMLLATAVALGTSTAAVLGVGSPAQAAETVTVEKIVDGDTIDVRTGDLVSRVRLLNIDTPEMKSADGPPECLAVEATSALAELLPIGSAVQLDYDKVRQDRYGRVLAAVVNANGVMVDAELAHRGLAFPADFGDNERFLPAVTQAFRDAEAAKVGFFDPAVACAPSAVVAALETQADTLPRALPTDDAGLASAIIAAVAVMESAEAAGISIDRMSWLSTKIQRSFMKHVDAVDRVAEDLKRDAVGQLGAGQSSADKAPEKAQKADAKKSPEAKKKAAAAKKKRNAAAKRALDARIDATARAAAEAARLAQEAAAAEAARIAQEAAAAEAARVAAEQAAAQEAARQAAPAPAPAPAPEPPTSSGDGGGSTYPGCRNYNGYGMIDSKGRHFEPIAC